MPGEGKPFVKGDPRCSRSGRPRKGTSMTDCIEYELNQVMNLKEGGKDIKLLKRQAIAKIAVRRALEGDMQAFKYLCDRIDGKPKETIKSETVVDDITNLTPEERKQRIMEMLNEHESKD